MKKGQNKISNSFRKIYFFPIKPFFLLILRFFFSALKGKMALIGFSVLRVLVLVITGVIACC